MRLDKQTKKGLDSLVGSRILPRLRAPLLLNFQSLILCFRSTFRLTRWSIDRATLGWVVKGSPSTTIVSAFDASQCHKIIRSTHLFASSLRYTRKVSSYRPYFTVSTMSTRLRHWRHSAEALAMQNAIWSVHTVKNAAHNAPALVPLMSDRPREMRR